MERRLALGLYYTRVREKLPHAFCQGMARKLTIVDDIETGRTPQNITTIHMTSDVLSVAQLQVRLHLAPDY